MTDPIRWGIAGPGRMAAAIVPEFRLAGNAELVAVGSRSAERAESFATEHDIPRWHASYDALVNDSAVDAIYVATPHPQHTDIALAAIAAGKAILVEKAFTATVDDTERIATAAREAGVFAMEAMWTRFNPAIAHLREVIARGEIGEVRGCQGDLTAFRESVAIDRRIAALAEPTAEQLELAHHARLVQYCVIFDRIFRFAITGNRVRNYDGLGGQLLFAWLHQHHVLHWTDTQLAFEWDRVPDCVNELGAAIEPEQAGADRLHADIDGNAGAAADRRYRHPPDALGGHAGAQHRLAHGMHERLQPDLREPAGDSRLLHDTCCAG